MGNKAALEKLRLTYAHLKWRSTSGIETFIYDMDDNYLINVLKKCVEKQIIAERLSFMVEAQGYETRTYKEWVTILTNEYKFRQYVMEVQIVENEVK